MHGIARVLMVLALMVIAAGCSDDGSTNPSTSPLTLSFSGLGPLGPNMVYEGWLVVGGSPKSIGTFTVDAAGVPSKTAFTVSNSDLSIATTFFLTVEPMNGNAAPSEWHLLAGTFSGKTAPLSVAHPEAFGTSLSSSSGAFHLSTPTDDTNTNEKSGLWFARQGSPNPEVGLQLALLPTGWLYEGWVVIGGTMVSTGKFSNVNTADLSNQYGSIRPGYLFPGEDFLNNPPGNLTFPTDLSGAMTMITVEPDPDHTPDPFMLKLLTGEVPTGAIPRKDYPLNYDAARIPAGMATR